MEEPALLRCSFCGKSQNEVKKLVLGPGVYICDECVFYCDKIVDEEVWGRMTSLEKFIGEAQSLVGNPVLEAEISKTPSLDRLAYAELLFELALAIRPDNDPDSSPRG